MSTTSKIFNSIVIASLANIPAGVYIGNYEYLRDKSLSDSIFRCLHETFRTNSWNGIKTTAKFSTPIAVASTSIDKFIFQNVTNNEAIQYGLTTAIALIGAIGADYLLHPINSNAKEYPILKSTNFINDMSTVFQALAFKYIWDQDDIEEFGIIALCDIYAQDQCAFEIVS